MLLEIVQYGNPVLKEKCRPVEHLDASLKDLANNMLETMYAAEGVGLAAPQVNVPVQLVVIDIPAEEESVTWLKVDGEDKQRSGIGPSAWKKPRRQVKSLLKCRDTAQGRPAFCILRCKGVWGAGLSFFLHVPESFSMILVLLRISSGS